MGVDNVVVELWYAGPRDEMGNFYQPDNYRGQVVTNECGEYSFVQTFPAVYPARPILHNHFRLSRNGVQLLVTQMYFEGNGLGYIASGSRPMQSVSVAYNNVTGARWAEFDTFVDVSDNNNTASEQCPSVLLPVSPISQSTTSNAAPTLWFKPMRMFFNRLRSIWKRLFWNGYK